MARIAQERLWHPTQTTKAMDDLGEKVELRMQLGNLEEVKHLVMSWGACAKVIAPAELRDAVKKEAAAVVRGYKKQ
jgi:predicted DNA-binding transcriptional regulator YafY